MKIEFENGAYLSIDRLVTKDNYEMLDITSTTYDGQTSIHCIITKDNALKIAADIMDWFKNETVLQPTK